jgi:hypothetical protein
MSEIMHFRGILPPAGQEFAPPPSQASPGGLILRVLHPLRGDLAAALAQGDQGRALRIAYTALGQVADALAGLRGARLGPDQARIHLLLVQLTWLPLEVHADGTLSEAGTLVEVHYRDWVVPRADAQAYADRLMARFQALWPGAWVVVSD